MTSTTVVDAVAAYEQRTPRSRALHAEASRVIAGGVSRRTLAFQPYPFYAASASGATITDVDGNRYLDLVNNYTSLVHGHAHPASVAAAEHALRTAALGAANPEEGEYAAELVDRLPALERLHFATTGSEATVYAVRLARAATGRARVLTFEGGFHGSHGEFLNDIAPAPALAPGTAIPARPSSAGLEPTAAVTAVYNDPDSVAEAFTRWGDEIAAVIVEPFLGNSSLIEAERPFLDTVFRAAHAAGALVVFDEVQSLRAGYGAAHGRWGYTPDLVATGKIMGGGHPLAVYGGRADLLEPLDGAAPTVLQPGTFTAAPQAIAAGRAAMAEMTPEAYDALEARTERVRAGIRSAFADAGVPVHVNGVGSMLDVSISEAPVTRYRDHVAADAAALSAFRMALLLRGVVIAPRGTGCLSTAITDADVDTILTAVADAAATIRR